MKFRVTVGDRIAEVEAVEGKVCVDGESAPAVIRRTLRAFVISIRGRRFEVRPGLGGAFVNGIWRQISTSEIREEVGPLAGPSEARTLWEVRPPMPGRVVSVLVAPGQAVRRGQPLLILEAMKMQNEVPAPIPGVVEAVKVRQGDSVTLHELLAVILGS